ncbi:hypothetical protein CONCODRAFT_10712 [Conidiobolus coronatus NRRL 28638]|uniref:Uncharacterized protein n=1 Tax=Conidiobolus coronatus (strain ATCC 28846 / CBS 209.66 / NRRL 28638) TaxID=796925 RepID=A0A137NWQ6_CONC2|nr:hypothetical protein CONCODRAFT_10712 [Conidiobolus coronatus NRRL 28638]|eukprot:KXN67270.1 hypothetical protein CONCODRAFT_10712 [Conidiobolus coronatus NRRL 28638]
MFNINFKSVLKTSLDKLANRVSTLNNNTTNNNTETNKVNKSINNEVEEVNELALHNNLKENWQLIRDNNIKLNLLAQEISTKYFLLNHTQLQFSEQSSELIQNLKELPNLVVELENTTQNMISVQDKLSKLDELIDWIDKEEKLIMFDDWKLDQEKELVNYFELTRKNYNEKMDLLNSQLLSNYNINQSTLTSILPSASDFPTTGPIPSSESNQYNTNVSEDPIQQSKLDLDNFYSDDDSDIPTTTNNNQNSAKIGLNSTKYSFNFDTSSNNNGNNLIAGDEDYPE